ncbi:MAG: hypothetical protein [Wendovervirus sonii]|uniref:Uncharacterized protein n=1 Tax=phage Lak_Megaphage_Sonny TaxID=3109229 RepID=A0ABZ0Z2P0_9CAUD|nr:MAG: hypothetical protein [phage Lak_Megaphage_Sonny]
MKEETLFKITDYDKYPELVSLWNEWHRKTCFLSTGNFRTPEWEHLIEYTKKHPVETADFIFDYLSEIGGGWPILSLFDFTFINPMEENEYHDPNSRKVIKLYKWCCQSIIKVLKNTINVK